MRILITAGGTQEPIDSVRSITNHATGRLGAMIADHFAKIPEVSKIFYVCGRQSLVPETEKAQVIRIKGTVELEQMIRTLSDTEHPDVIIHSMAVSDYRVRQVTTVTSMAEAAMRAEGQALDQLSEAIAGADAVGSDGKIRSSVEDLVILLEKTPKIISLLRDLAPQAVIVGFKLLDGVSEAELLGTAEKLMEANDCDFVLANDLETVTSPCHCGYLLDQKGSVMRCDGKSQIAGGIVEAVLRKVAAG
jgi:phosphopantothenate-cysteine ligase